MEDDKPLRTAEGYVPIVGEIVGDGEVRVIPGNGMMSAEQMRAAFGPHPWADWKYTPPKRKGRRWMK